MELLDVLIDGSRTLPGCDWPLVVNEQCTTVLYRTVLYSTILKVSDSKIGALPQA